MSDQEVRLWLIRHGSLSGAHTSRTDIHLIDRGRERAAHMADHLRKQEFSLVLTSPRQRARETCVITGYGDIAQVDPDLSEWDYGEYDMRLFLSTRTNRNHARHSATRIRRRG